MKKRNYISSCLDSDREYLVDKVSEWEEREGEVVLKRMEIRGFVKCKTFKIFSYDRISVPCNYTRRN